MTLFIMIGDSYLYKNSLKTTQKEKKFKKLSKKLTEVEPFIFTF